MNPDLEKRVELLEKNENNATFQKVVNRLIQNATDVTSANVSRSVTVTISDSSDEIEVLDYPDKWLRVLYNGKTYRVPAYLESEDSSR